MNSIVSRARMCALAYLYDNMHDLSNSFGHLTLGQLEEIAEVLPQWRFPNELNIVPPIEEIERRKGLGGFGKSYFARASVRAWV